MHVVSPWYVKPPFPPTLPSVPQPAHIPCLICVSGFSSREKSLLAFAAMSTLGITFGILSINDPGNRNLEIKARRLARNEMVPKGFVAKTVLDIVGVFFSTLLRLGTTTSKAQRLKPQAQSLKSIP